TPTYWVLGFGIMFGGAGALIGGFDPFVQGDYASVLPAGIPLFAFLIFQTVFCATSATIVSGSMAERTKFVSYCIYSFCISAFIYPISGHWIWGGGWLSQLGFHDFAGSTAVHMVGGICACIGAAMLGPRIGKYDKDGKPRAIIGHNLALGALGVFILWFCWFGFNGCSTVAMDSDDAMVSAGLIFFNTNMSAAVACCVTMLYTWLRYKKPDIGMTLNAGLAGLVAITAGCDVVSPVGAAIIGIIAGLLLPISVNFFDAVLKIDDPVGAISVHGVCGSAGTLMTGLFAVDGGVFYGGGFHFFGIQCLGVAATALWTTVMITIVFLVIKHTIGLRVSVEEELKGLDITEHGLPSAYGGFAFNYDDTPADLAVPAGSIPVQEAVPVEVVSTPVPAPVSSDGVKMTKIEILCKMERFDALKRAMFDIGITGMTAINVMGCGEQRGKTEGYFRGAKVEATMLPSIQVSIVVCKLPVSLVVNTAKKVLYTGHYGDGKIFIYNVENVIKVRTGEQGYDALQDEVQ
ncbi:MAG: ammonium transporter, partial [Oscillibacter sp.]|nr:ammonium transporter [Oscillibacter sp.]